MMRNVDLVLAFIAQITLLGEAFSSWSVLGASAILASSIVVGCDKLVGSRGGGDRAARAADGAAARAQADQGALAAAVEGGEVSEGGEGAESCPPHGDGGMSVAGEWTAARGEASSSSKREAVAEVEMVAV